MSVPIVAMDDLYKTYTDLAGVFLIETETPVPPDRHCIMETVGPPCLEEGAGEDSQRRMSQPSNVARWYDYFHPQQDRY